MEQMIRESFPCPKDCSLERLGRLFYVCQLLYDGHFYLPSR